MAIKRRHVLQGLGFAAMTSLGGGLQQWYRYGNAAALSAATDHRGQHWLTGISTDGETRFRLAVPHRAHQAVILQPGKLAVYFARHPGQVMYVVDLRYGRLLDAIPAPTRHHFCGHGAISSDGKYLFTSETHSGSGRGIIGVYSTQAPFLREDQYPSAGIDPHQLAVLHQQNVIVVANGGQRNLPDREHNRPSDETSNLTYLDMRNGEVIDRVFPPHHRMSLRHLSVNNDNQVVVGVQDQSPPELRNPLLLIHRLRQPLTAMAEPYTLWQNMRQYIASVATSNDGEYAVTTSPRGHCASLWHLPTTTAVKHFEITGVAGAVWAEPERHFLLSNSRGQILYLQPLPKPKLNVLAVEPATQWDNHLTLA